jgi:hypothetical protein
MNRCRYHAYGIFSGVYGLGYRCGMPDGISIKKVQKYEAE